MWVRTPTTQLWVYAHTLLNLGSVWDKWHWYGGIVIIALSERTYNMLHWYLKKMIINSCIIINSNITAPDLCHVRQESDNSHYPRHILHAFTRLHVWNSARVDLQRSRWVLLFLRSRARYRTKLDVKFLRTQLRVSLASSSASISPCLATSLSSGCQP